MKESYRTSSNRRAGAKRCAPEASVLPRISPKVVVLCVNASGIPEFFHCCPRVTHQQMIDGYHYDAAKILAVNSGYSEPMIAFDKTDHAARQLGEAWDLL